jgi:predicted Zn-dependent protease
MRYWLLILLLSVICLPCTAVELPDIGSSANAIMSATDEQKLGEAFFRQLHRQAEVIDDIDINDYINALGHRLASFSDNPEQSFRFFVIKDAAINAFAVPGGFIGVHSGLISNTRDESELASVVAHEIAHVTQHHIARTIEAMDRLSLPAMAALIAAIVVGATVNPQIGQAAAATLMAGSVQMQINFTRTHEKEADRVGMQILASAGFDPRSMPAFFERLQTATRYYENGVPEFLRTHPVTSDRIAEAQSRADKYPVKLISDAPLYHLMKAKLLVLSDDNPNNLLKKLQEMLKEGRYRDERATRYALALTLLTSKQLAGVQEQLDWLLKHDTDRVVYRLLKAQLAWLQNDNPKAMQIYQQALEVFPNDQQLGLDYAEKLLQNHLPANAKTVLLTLSPSLNPAYYRLLAQAYQDTGVIAEAQLALAEHYYLSGQTALAVEQLKQARQLKKLDYYIASRIEARYVELKRELQEEEAVASRNNQWR